MNKKTIVIGGPVYGLHNIGDEALLLGILKTFSASKRIVLSYDSKWLLSEFDDVILRKIDAFYTKPRFGLSATPRKKIITSFKNSFFPKIEYFDDADLFICGGGTILSECPHHVFKLCSFAKKKKVPTIMWGVGCSDILNEKDRLFVREKCNDSNIKAIYVRDFFVKARLESYGVFPNKLHVSFDPAFVLSKSNCNLKRMVGEKCYESILSSKRKVCISLAGEKDNTWNLNQYEMVKYVKKLVEYDCLVYLVPTGCGSHCRDLAHLMKLNIHSNTFLIRNELRPEDLIELLSKMDLIVSSRLHCNILGALSSVPSISLIRNSKQIDFSKLFDLPLFSFENLSSDVLFYETKRILLDLVNQKNKIQKIVSNIKKEYKIASEEVKKSYLI